MAITLLLDRAEVFSDSQETLAEKAWHLVLTAFEGEGVEEDDVLRQLPRPWRAVYTTVYLESQVDNGGHHQFFWNSEGRLNNTVQSDLQFIGAIPFADIFARALRIYKAHDYCAEKKEAAFNWLGFTAAYRERRMRALDDAFYKQP